MEGELSSAGGIYLNQRRGGRGCSLSAVCLREATSRGRRDRATGRLRRRPPNGDPPTSTAGYDALTSEPHIYLDLGGAAVVVAGSSDKVGVEGRPATSRCISTVCGEFLGSGARDTLPTQICQQASRKNLTRIRCRTVEAPPPTASLPATSDLASPSTSIERPVSPI